MRQIEKQLLQHIIAGKPFKLSNTHTELLASGKLGVYLYNNRIAVIDTIQHSITLFSAGWQTTTTKSRLNALLYGSYYGVQQKNGEWYLNNKAIEYHTKFVDGITIENFSIARNLSR